ncbi:hypothetical protein DUI87_02985 [Hirundo rustica rustica]|uniref:Uncharacterized protein n=1 Tax=Hirundo rustica rustica TaxID=333673 RepID=A0A3M0L938_HIRRU|nr:hypothetical protein DUI87_02985 [Hirundo rustica rustica]
MVWARRGRGQGLSLQGCISLPLFLRYPQSFIRAPEEGSRSERSITPFPQSTIRDLCKAHRDYGRDSPYFRGLLRSDLDAAVIIPADLKQLFSCLLDSTEFKLWVAAWRQQLREALPSLLRDPETAVDDNGNPLTLEHLMVNHVTMPSEEDHEEEGLELEEVLEGTPEDEERNLDEEEHELGYPTQHR